MNKKAFGIILIFCLWNSLAHAEKKPDAKPSDPKTSDAQSKDKAAAAKKETPEPKAPPPKIEGPDAANALGSSRPTRYVHQWLYFPKVFGVDLITQERVSIATQKGRAKVLFFLASWCEPCQNLTPMLKDLTQRFQHLPVDFHFLFAHDTLSDARGFLTEHQISEALLIEFETLKNFNNPDLPTVYLSDRDGWLLTRLIKPGPKEIEKFKEQLDLLLAF